MALCLRSSVKPKVVTDSQATTRDCCFQGSSQLILIYLALLSQVKGAKATKLSPRGERCPGVCYRGLCWILKCQIFRNKEAHPTNSVNPRMPLHPKCSPMCQCIVRSKGGNLKDHGSESEADTSFLCESAMQYERCVSMCAETMRQCSPPSLLSFCHRSCNQILPIFIEQENHATNLVID